MLKKSVGFIVGMIIIACMMTVMVSADDFDLGNFTLVDEESNQVNGWCTNGVDGVATNLTWDTVKNAEVLRLEFSEQIDSILLVAFGDGDDWGWDEFYVDVDGTEVEIELAEIVEDWADIISGTMIKILLVNRDPSWDGIQVNAVLSSGEASEDLNDDADSYGEDPTDEEVPGDEEEPTDEETPTEEEPTDAPTTAAPTTKPTPDTGDSAIIFILLAAVLAGTFVFTKRLMKNKA